MLSCDTMAVAAKFSRYGQNMLAKNSDRPTAEAQKLVFFPAKDYAPGETVRCTDLEIPQAAHTYAMIGSQPYWTWGFEITKRAPLSSSGALANLSRITPFLYS